MSRNFRKKMKLYAVLWKLLSRKKTLSFRSKTGSWIGLKQTVEARDSSEKVVRDVAATTDDKKCELFLNRL